MKNISILFFIPLIILACKSEDPKPGDDGLTSLISVKTEPLGTNCPTGGSRIDIGIDKNSDGILTQDEVQSNAYVCNGVNGLTSLMNINAESPGGNCSSSGYKIDTGIDLNGNGLLETGEITKTVYICNGSILNYGKQTIVLSGDVTDAEAAQIISSDFGTATQEIRIVECTNLTTVDLSSLESAIDIYVVDNPQLRVLNLSGLKILSGDLYIESLKLESLNLESLVSVVYGDISVGYTNLLTLSFPSMKNVSKSINIYNNSQLSSLSFPLLATCNSILISENVDLLEASVPSLASADIIDISGNASITNVDLPELTTCNTILISENVDLLEASVPSLASADIIKIRGNVSITNVDLAELTTVQRIDFGWNSSLGTIDLPKLHICKRNVNVYYNDTLVNLLMPMLNTMEGWETGGFSIAENPNLVNIQMPQLLIFGSSEVLITNNKLPSGQINSLLANFSQIIPAISGKVINLQQTPPAPPTGQGIIDKNILVSNGNTVSTN